MTLMNHFFHSKAKKVTQKLAESKNFLYLGLRKLLNIKQRTIMNRIFKKLGLSLSDIKTEEELSMAFSKIAKMLFYDYEIICGKKHFHFAEIEFYYYHKGAFEEDWNKTTYERKIKKNGKLLYHNSGVDICFASDFSGDSAEFGGILIRSLYTINKKGKKKLVFGPYTCRNEMANSCGKLMPELRRTKEKVTCDIRRTSLAGIPEKMQKDNCFFDNSILLSDWTREVERYNKDDGNPWIYKARYDTKRFINSKECL